MKQFNAPADVMPYFSALPYDALMEARHENHALVPNQRGIYFWFLREQGFEILSQKLPVLLRPPQHTLQVGDAYLVLWARGDKCQPRGGATGRQSQILLPVGDSA